MRFCPRFSLFALVCGAVLGFSFALPLPREGAIFGLPSLCPFYNGTGLPCPGCGLTRAFVCLAHGQWVQAWGFHPLGPLLFLGAIAGVFSAFWAPPKFPERVQKWALATGAALIFSTWMLRLSGIWPLPA